MPEALENGRITIDRLMMADGQLVAFKETTACPMVERTALFFRFGWILDLVVDRVFCIDKVDPDIEHFGFAVDPPRPDQFRHAVKLRIGPCQRIGGKLIVWPKAKSDAANEIPGAHATTQNKTVIPTPDKILIMKHGNL